MDDRDSENMSNKIETENNVSSVEMSENNSVGPLLFMWNWFITIPQSINRIYTKSGEFLSKFTLLDAILQFIFAIATSCHPPEEGMYEKYEEDKTEKRPSGKKVCDGVEVFGGHGRTLRSRTIETN